MEPTSALAPQTSTSSTPRSVRIQVSLDKENPQANVFSYAELLRQKMEEMNPGKAAADAAAAAAAKAAAKGTDGSDSEGSDGPDDTPKKRKKRMTDDYYDIDDEFIDDSDLFFSEVGYVAPQEIESGFFAWRGPVENFFKEYQPNPFEREPPAKPPKSATTKKRGAASDSKGKGADDSGARKRTSKKAAAASAARTPASPTAAKDKNANGAEAAAKSGGTPKKDKPSATDAPPASGSASSTSVDTPPPAAKLKAKSVKKRPAPPVVDAIEHDTTDDDLPLTHQIRLGNIIAATESSKLDEPTLMPKATTTQANGGSKDHSGEPAKKKRKPSLDIQSTPIAHVKKAPKPKASTDKATSRPSSTSTPKEAKSAPKKHTTKSASKSLNAKLETQHRATPSPAPGPTEAEILAMQKREEMRAVLNTRLTELEQYAAIILPTPEEPFRGRVGDMVRDIALLAYTHDILDSRFFDRLIKVVPIRREELAKIVNRMLIPRKLDSLRSNMRELYESFKADIAEASANAPNSPTPDGRLAYKFPWTDALRAKFWNILCGEWEMADLDNEYNATPDSGPGFTQSGVRKAIYAKVLAYWPPNMMNADALSRLYSFMKRKLEKYGEQGIDTMAVYGLRSDPFLSTKRKSVGANANGTDTKSPKPSPKKSAASKPTGRQDGENTGPTGPSRSQPQPQPLQHPRPSGSSKRSREEMAEPNGHAAMSTPTPAAVRRPMSSSSAASAAKQAISISSLTAPSLEPLHHHHAYNHSTDHDFHQHHQNHDANDRGTPIHDDHYARSPAESSNSGTPRPFPAALARRGNDDGDANPAVSPVQRRDSVKSAASAALSSAASDSSGHYRHQNQI
ncbi:hypothetical protein HDU88_002670 [Geranomyces variabilis]|nr:hypothetical protein HDU88_002670 [Geranomyces variabilis]